MTQKIADRLAEGLREAIALADGTADCAGYGVHEFKSIDVKAVREKTHLSQDSPEMVFKTLRDAQKARSQ